MYILYLFHSKDFNDNLQFRLLSLAIAPFKNNPPSKINGNHNCPPLPVNPLALSSRPQIRQHHIRHHKILSLHKRPPLFTFYIFHFAFSHPLPPQTTPILTPPIHSSPHTAPGPPFFLPPSWQISHFYTSPLSSPICSAFRLSQAWSAPRKSVLLSPAPAL
jgi:hypothetical protein